MVYLIIISIMLLSIGLFLIPCALWEKKAFNKGKCTHCNVDMKLFDYDSHGGRGYACPNCAHKVWISYNIIDKDFRRKHND
jgi:DNA-directed RNA polymerase subunit RPC12/RpoP